MSVNIIKLCVGVESVEHLMEIREADLRNKGLNYNFHITRSKPRRYDEVLDGGSLYWVIKGFILARQYIISLDEVKTQSGTKCMIKLDKKIFLTEPQPRRAFQGWRYLENSVAPVDLVRGEKLENIPHELRKELKELGLI